MYLVDQLDRISMAVFYLSIVQIAHLPVEIILGVYLIYVTDYGMD